MDKKEFVRKIWQIVYSDEEERRNLIELWWTQIENDKESFPLEAEVMPNEVLDGGLTEEEQDFMEMIIECKSQEHSTR